MGGALLHIQEEFNASEGMSEFIVAAAKLGAVGGTFLGGALMLYYGRRRAIAVDSFFFIVGPITMATSWNVVGLILGRFLVGIGIGISAVVVPAYLGEVAPAKARGRVVELYEVMLCLGMLTSALADAALDDVPGNWRWMVGAPAIPAVLMSLAVCLLPESPRWLVVSGRLDDALAVIHRVHTSQLLPVGAQYSTAEVENELMELWSSVERDKDAAARRAEEARLRRRGGGNSAGASGQGGGRLAYTARDNNSNLPGADASNLIRNKKYTPEMGQSGSGNGGLLGFDNSNCGGGGGGSGNGGNNTDKIEHELARLNAGNEDSAAFANAPAWPPPRPPSSQQQRPSSAGGGNTSGNDGLRSQGCAEGAGSGEYHQSSRSMSRASSSGLADCLTAVDTDTVLGIPQRLPRIRTQSRDRLYAMEQEALAAELAVAAEEAASGAGTVGNGARLIGEETAALSPTPKLPESTPKLDVHSPSSSSDYHYRNQHSQQLTTGGGGGGGSSESKGFWTTSIDMMKDILAVARGPESSAFTMILILAFFNQAFASTAIINYAPSVLQNAGVESSSAASLFTSLIGASKLAGVIIAFFLIDTVGRRPLLFWGSLGSSISLFLLIPGDYLDSHPLLVTGMCLFIFSFSISWAGVFWVLLSESFSMGAKSPAASAATAVLFLTGAVADMVFLSFHSWMGPFAFGLYGIIAAAAAVYVYFAVPETKGRNLLEVQEVLASQRRRR
ncbi:hypothetical protein Ndes2526B_g02211 [Nannochloris sp. 'desiccata']